MFFLAFPVKSPEEIKKNNEVYRKFGLLRWEDGKDHDLPQDFADMIGWSELARKVDSVYHMIPQKENTWVFCDNYGEAGAINYYSKFKNINAVSLSADYINWIEFKNEIKNVILVKDPHDDDPARVKEKPLTESITLAWKNDNPYSREKGSAIYLIRGVKAKVDSIIAREIEQRKR